MDLSPAQLKILKSLSAAGGTGNVMEILNYTTAQFEEGFNVANDLQNMDLVKLLYSGFNKNIVVVELTLWGQSNAENHNP